MPTIADIQKVLFPGQPDQWDGVWGNHSQKTLDAIVATAKTQSSPSAEHHVKASSFADPSDIKAFKRCKERGGTDQDCFKVGDNGIGCWNDNVAEGTGASCALPPEDMEERWGSVNGAKHKLVEVSANGRVVTCVLRDRMPHRANIKNGAGIDLNPDAVRALGLEPPIMVSAVWKWA
jgi:hypothetical protein